MTNDQFPRIRRFLPYVLVVLLVAFVLFLGTRPAKDSPGAPAANRPASTSVSSGRLTPSAPVAAANSAWSPSHPAGPNAADLYKNAYALYNALSAEEKKMLANPREEVDAETAAALFKKIQPIMELLRQAGTAAYCDWAMGPMSANSVMPQLNPVMKLGTVARWSAGYQFLSANPEGAIADLATQSALGQSIGKQAMLGYLVATSLNTGVINLVRDNAGSLSPEAATQALKMLGQSRQPDDLQQAMNTEAQFVLTWAEQLANPATRNQALENFGIEGLDGISKNTDSINAQIHWCAQVDRDFAAKAQLSDAEFKAWWAQINQQGASQPIAALVLPALDSMRTQLQKTSVNNSMLAAGLAILQSGPGQLGTQLDPTTGQPFSYVQTATGFELRSTFQTKGKPVIMSFSNPN